jgi:murein DD-endopeptidase MepM/ murein hydrolase activator NlpD
LLTERVVSTSASRRIQLRRVAAGLVLLCALLPASTAAVAHQPRDELERIERELDQARRQLADLEGREQGALADLARSDARQRELAAELALREEELRQAEAELSRVEAALAETSARLLQTRQRLAETRIELAELREQFRSRARASYMYGGTAQAPAAALEVRDVSMFQRALGYVRTVLDGDRLTVESIETLEAEIDRDARALDGLQERQRDQRAQAELQRNDVAALVETTRALEAEAQAEVDRHQQILAQLEADQAQSESLIASLGAESDRLTEELRARERAAAAQGGPDRPGPPAGSGRFQRPSGGRQSSGFGPRVHPIFGTTRMHTGLDFGAPAGSPIYAAESGVVVSAAPRGGYGNATVIDHGGGVATLYAHQSRFGVSAGQRVQRGQVIGYVGSTGYSTGPHLHFEVRVNGSPVDPARYL